jgi:prepilin-type N-terminal cleavage/methylation domain-containing protein
MNPHSPTRNKAEAGFSLVELMVVVVIIAILAAVAVVSFGRDNTKGKFDGVTRQMNQLIQSARNDAISSPDDQLISITASSFTLYTAQVGSVDLIQTETSGLNRVEIPDWMEISGVAMTAATKPTDNPVSALPAVIRFYGTQEVGVDTGEGAGEAIPGTSSATIFIQSKDSTLGYFARIVIYGTTGYVHYYPF